MKKESEAISSRGDGKGSCSQMKSPKGGALYGASSPSRRRADPTMDAREMRGARQNPSLSPMATSRPNLRRRLCQARPPLLKYRRTEYRRAAPTSPSASSSRFHRSHHVAQDLSLFNSLLVALGKSCHAGKAASLVRALERRFPPDVATYNTLADGWCRVKDTSRALDVLRQMVESGITPTKTTYNVILKGFFRAGQLQHAWDLFLQMKKRGCKDESCKPDVVSYTTVVHGLGVAGQLDKARNVFDEMSKEGCMPSVVAYNALIQVICKKGNVEDALTVFDDILFSFPMIADR